MKLDKLNPWNWFKHEDNVESVGSSIPVKKQDATPQTYGSPVDSFLQLHREMDRLFDDAFRNFGMPSLSRRLEDTFKPLSDLNAGFKPSTDVSGDDKQYEITLDLPGMKEEDVTIELKDRVLTIKGEKESEVEKDDKKFYRVERHYGSFQRTLALPDDAAAEDITASMKDGVLTLSLPRVALPNQDVKRISITS
jgi:HSP20 family protein